MSPHTAVRGLRRAELITTDPLASLRFHKAVLGWRAVQSDTGFDCWVGERRCALIRTAKAGERAGWQLVFAGASQDSSLTGPDNTYAVMTKGRAQHGPWAPNPRTGEPCWIELFADDADRADEFWTDTLSWTVLPDVAPPQYAAGGRPVANRRDACQPDGQWGWLCYFTVADLEKAAEQVQEWDGKIVERASHAELGDTLVIADPHGAVCALTTSRGSWG